MSDFFLALCTIGFMTCFRHITLEKDINTTHLIINANGPEVLDPDLLDGLQVVVAVVQEAVGVLAHLEEVEPGGHDVVHHWSLPASGGLIVRWSSPHWDPALTDMSGGYEGGSSIMSREDTSRYFSTFSR